MSMVSKPVEREEGSTIELTELLKLLANFGSIELEDVVIRAKKIIIKPLRR